MRKLRLVLTELKHLLEFAIQGHVNRLEIIILLILLMIGLGSLIVGIIWYLNQVG